MSFPCDHVLLGVALTDEWARPIEVHPSAVPAILDSPRRTTQAHIVWGIYGRWGSEWNNEGLDVHDVVGPQIHAVMNAKGLLLEGLSRREHFHAAASVLHGQRALLDGGKNMTGMVMPGEDFPRRDRELSHRDDGRTADEF